MAPRCQADSDIDSGAMVCGRNVSLVGLYCKGCRERMMANGRWTEAHAKLHSELRVRANEKKRARHARLSVEEKEARRLRDRAATAMSSTLPKGNVVRT